MIPLIWCNGESITNGWLVNAVLILSICLCFSCNVSIHWIIFNPIDSESMPIEDLAVSLTSSTLDKLYLPLDASLAKDLSLSILVLAIFLAVGCSFKIALIALLLTSTIVWVSEVS